MVEQFSDFGDNGFSATIQGITLFDYLQLVIMTQKTVLIKVKCKDTKGVIQTSNGKITYSKTDDFFGEEAFFDILTWTNGNFKSSSEKLYVDINIEDRGNLLLKAAEYIDKKAMEYKHFEKDETSLESLGDENKYSGQLKDIDVETPKDFCGELLSGCPLFDMLSMRADGDKWISEYCKGDKYHFCERVKRMESDEELPADMLPDGSYVWDHIF